MKCCNDQKPINIGMLTEKWVCKECDADLEPTDKIGVFNVKPKPKININYSWDASGYTPTKEKEADEAKGIDIYSDEDPYWSYIRGYN